MAEASGLASIDELTHVVDADAHVYERFHDVLEHADDRYDGVTELMSVTSSPMSHIYTAATPTPSFYYDRKGSETGGIVAGGPGIERTIELMDELDVSAGVLSPTMNLLLPSVNNSRFAVALANAYNNWVLDVLADYDDRLKANLLVAPQKPDAAAEEVDRVADEDLFVGIQFPAALVPPAGHRMYDPIYEAAQDHDLPVAMHSTSGPKAFPQMYAWNETYAADHLLQNPFEHMWNLTTMLFEGVPVRFPDVDFVVQEAGIGYVPYLVHRMDDHYLEMGYEIPMLDTLPSEYVRNHFYFCTQPLGHSDTTPGYVSSVVEQIGPDRVMFAADFPHPDFDTPRELFDRIRSDFDAETVRRIMGETAIELYGLGA